MFGFDSLKDLFFPGKRRTIPRTANRFKKGYLKKSQFSGGSWSSPRQPQGEQEKTRRLRQIERGVVQK